MRSLRTLTVVPALAGILFMGLQASAPVWANDHEVPGPRAAKDVLPKDLAAGPNYRVADPIVLDGYMYRFTVNSPYGLFEPTGLGALRKLLTEIRAITGLRQVRTSKAFATAVADSATGPLKFGKNLILHPVDTVSGIPKGTWKLMEEAGEAITSERDPSDDPAYKKALLVSGRKREYAAQYGVDVYSSNTVLQKELNSVAWAAAVGNLSVSAALLPVGGTAGVALSTVRWSNALNDYMKVEPAPRLRIINGEKLTAAGIPADLAERYLNHPSFTPRHDTIIAEALARLGKAQGRDQLLQRALSAEDEVDANLYTNIAQILRGYHETVSPITNIQVLGGRLVVAQAQNGNALVPLPIDYGMWTTASERRIDELKAKYQAPGFNGKFDLWLTGTVSPVARQRLTARGMTVAEEVYKRVEIID